MASHLSVSYPLPPHASETRVTSIAPSANAMPSASPAWNRGPRLDGRDPTSLVSFRSLASSSLRLRLTS